MARSSDERKKFLEILATTPFINHACKKVGVSRATIYRWMHSNYRFKQKVLKAQNSGRENLIELAEVTLVNKVRNGDLGAAKFFLTHNSNRYRNKVQIVETESNNSMDSFRSEDGEIRVSKQTAEMLRNERGEKQKHRNRSLGFNEDA